MLIPLVVAGLLAVAGWSLWFLCRIERRAVMADNEALNARVLLAEGKASAVRNQEQIAIESQSSAEAQVRVAKVELASIRQTLREALHDRDVAEARVRELEAAAHHEDMLRRSEEKLRLYSPRSAVPNREDG